VEIAALVPSVGPRVITFSEALEAYLEDRRDGRAPQFKKVARIAARVLKAVGEPPPVAQHGVDLPADRGLAIPKTPG